jgi:hypothetical protein
MRKPISQRRLKNDLKAFDNYFFANETKHKKMANILIKNKDYPTVEIDNSEKDVVQFIGIGKTETDIVFIERDKIKELIETLTYIEAGEC